MNDPQDFIDRTMVSDCCGAPILAPDFCSECREHCEAESIEPSERQLENLADPRNRAETPMENWEKNHRNNQ